MSKINKKELEDLSERITQKAEGRGYMSGKGDGERTQFKTDVQNITEEILKVSGKKLS